MLVSLAVSQPDRQSVTRQEASQFITDSVSMSVSQSVIWPGSHPNSQSAGQPLM